MSIISIITPEVIFFSMNIRLKLFVLAQIVVNSIKQDETVAYIDDTVNFGV